MPTTKRFTVVRGKRMRVVRLDECGNPPAGATPCAFTVTKGFISVALSSEMETGDDIVQKNADGDLCINDKSRDQFKRWNVEASFCEVDPSLLDMLTNVTLETDWQDNIVGVRQPEGSTIDSFALELWTGVPGSDCAPGEPTEYGYLLLPFVVGGPLGNITIENGAATFTAASYTRGAGGWGSGPFDVVPVDAENTPGRLITPMGATEHMLMRTTSIEPPAVTDGCEDMPEWEPPAPEITSIDPATGSTAGGDAIVLTGTNLTGSTGVTVDGVAATAFSVVSDTTINFTTPAGTAGTVDVVVQHPTANATLVDGFTYS